MKQAHRLCLTWVVSLLPILLLLIPASGAFTAELRLFFVITLCAILMFCLGHVEMSIVAFALPFAYVMAGLLELNAALSPYAGEIIWMGIACFIMVETLQRIGLMPRIAYWIITKTGGTYRGYIFGMLILGVVLDIIAPAPQVATVVFFLTASVCKAFQMKTGRTTAGMMFAAIFGCNSAQLFIYMPVQQGVALGLVGEQITWMGYLLSNIVFLPLLILLGVLLCRLLPPDEEFSGKAYFQAKLREMGPMSRDEKAAGIILILFVVFMLTQSLTGFTMYYGFLAVPVLLFVTGTAKREDVGRVNIGLLLFIGGCMCIGSAASAVGAGTFIANALLPLLSGMNSYCFTFFSYVLGVIVNFLLTPMAAMTALSQPLADIAAALGVSAKATLLAFCAGLEQYALPYEIGALTTAFALGCITMKDFLKVGLAKMALVTVFMLVIVIPYWMLIGMV